MDLGKVNLTEKMKNSPLIKERIKGMNFEWRTRYDGEEQADFMKASFEVFDKVPYRMGLLWRKWDETQNRPHYHDEAGKDKGFAIQGKPAEKIFREA